MQAAIADPFVENMDDLLRTIPMPVLRVMYANGYLYPKAIGPDRYACVMPLIFTAAIITIHIPTTSYCYEDRWCYHSLTAASAALGAWSGSGEPSGWHRHPTTGRRRPDGDPLQEYINP